MKPTALRADLFNVLDRVLAGEEVAIEHKGKRLRLVLDKPRKLRAWKAKPGVIIGSPDDLVHVEWPWGDEASR